MRRVALLALLAGCGPDAATGIQVHSISLELETHALAFTPEDQVVLRARVRDARGNELSDVPVTIVATPEGHATLDEQEAQRATFQLTGSGSVTFRACIASAPDRCDALTLVVDDGSPVLAVDEPDPGAELDDPGGILVRGTALDRTGVLLIYVNGVAARVDEQHRFEVVLPARYGVQHLEVVASDALNDPRKVEMDVLHADAFTKARDPGGTSYRLEGAAGIRLTQDFFDDGVPVDTAARPLQTHDLADLLQLAVAGLPLAAAIPDPVIDQPGLTLRIPSAALGEPQVQVALVDGGLDLFLRLPSMRLDTAGTLDLEDRPLDMTGRLEGAAAAHARLSITKTVGSEVVVSVQEVQVVLESLQGTFDRPEVAAVFAIAGGLLRTQLETELQAAVGGLLQDSLPSLLQGLLASLDHALEGQTFTLGDPLPPVTATIDGRVRSFDITRRGSLDAPLSVTLSVDSTAIHASRGIARSNVSGAGFLGGGPVQVAAELPFLNGVFQLLWAAGALDLDVVTIVPEAALLFEAAQLQPKLPPLLRPARAGEVHPLTLSLGQVELAATYQGEPLRFGLSIDVGVDVLVEGGRLRLQLEDEPTVRAWTISGSTESGLGPQLVAGALLAGWSQLKEPIESLVAIDLPVPSLDGLAEVAPSLAGLTLQLQPDEGGPYLRGETLLIDAALTGTLPLIMRPLALLALVAACGSGSGFHHGPTPHEVTYPRISGVLAGRSPSGDFEVGVYDVDLDVQLIPMDTLGTAGTATGTLYAGADPVPLTGTYSEEGVLDLEGGGYALHQMNEFGNFDGPYTGPVAAGWYSAMAELDERHCGTVSGDETGVLAFVIASGQVRLDFATAERNVSSAGDIERGMPDTLKVDGPERLRLDGTRTEGGGFTGTWQARDHGGTWEATEQACPGP